MTAAVNASRVMRRRAAGEDLGDDDGDGAFWAGGAPRLYDFSQQEQKPFLPAPVQPSPAPVASPPSAAAESVAPCLLALQCSGVGWGVRKRVRYVGRHLARHALSLPADGDGERPVDAAQEDEASSTKSKKKDESPKEEKQEAAEEDDDHKVPTTKKKRKRGRGRGRGHGGAKRPKKEEEKKTLPSPKAEQLEEEKEEKAAVPAASGMIDRWKSTRYAIAEASLLAIMRAHGAIAGKPIPRGELRKEARAHIGDTGLLDHLLRHIADKVALGRTERFRRRHNADGALEYWLEPAELVAVRRKAGVADPYWVPPPGWKPGDPVSPEGYVLGVKKQVEQLAVELAGVKRHMDHLTSNVSQVDKEMKSEAEKSYNTWQEKYACMEKANGNLEKQLLSLEEKYENATHANGELKEDLLFLKEKYVSVVENNTRLEQQLAALSTSFLSLKDELLWLEKEEADLYVKEPWEDDDDKQEDDAGKEATDDDAAGVGAAANQPAVDGDATTTSTSNGGTDGRGGSGKRTSRKCSVRISKPQGTFQWPTPSLPFSPELAAPPSPPLTPTAPVAGAGSLANFATMDELYEYMMAGGLPTPPSASSTTNAAAGKLPLLPAAAACKSPVKTAALELDASGNVGTELALATPAY